MTEKDSSVAGFVGRWSRLKRSAARDRRAGMDDAGRAPGEGVYRDQPACADGETPAEDREMIRNREIAEAVDLEALDFESDFSVFMKKGVPVDLHRKAMRKLWRTSPVLANLDGLNDYEQTPADKVSGDVRSVWQTARKGAAELEKAQRASDPGSARSTGPRENAQANTDDRPSPRAGTDSAGEESTDPGRRRS